MSTFSSVVAQLCPLAFPPFTGVRVMMMPVELSNADSIPDTIATWRQPFLDLCAMAPFKEGVAYLTIDERLVRAGETHRRPGIHVDGVGPDGAGPWAKPAGWGSRGGGMVTGASHVGCRAWQQEFDGEPLANGDCSNIADQCEPSAEIILNAGMMYWFDGMTVHEGIVLCRDTLRQFVRLSAPTKAPWYEGYTPNPTGVLPTGPIHPPRPEAFMAGRNS